MGTSRGIYNATTTYSSAATITAYEIVEQYVTGYEWTITNTKSSSSSSTSTSSQTGGGETEPTGNDLTISVTKEWSDIASNKHTSDTVTVALYDTATGAEYNGSEYKSQGRLTLSSSNNWTASWTGLDADNDYKVKEVNVPSGYTAKETMTNTSYGQNVKTGLTSLTAGKTYAFLYTISGTTYALKSQGIDSNGNYYYVSGNEYTGNRTFTDEELWVAETASGGVYLKNKSDSTYLYVYSSKGFITHDSYKSVINYDGNYLSGVYSYTTYYMGSSSGIDYDTTTKSSAINITAQELASDTAVTGYDWTITNTKSSSSSSSSTSSQTGGGDTTSTGGKTIKVTKKWSDSATVDHSKDSVTVYLCKKGSDTEYTGSEYTSQGTNGRLTLSESNDWTASWTGLNANYEYEIKEANVPSGYTYTLQPDGNAETTVTLKPVEAFTSDKKYILSYSFYQDDEDAYRKALISKKETYVSGEKYVDTDGSISIPSGAMWTAKASDDGYILQNDDTKEYLYFNTRSGYFYTKSSRTTMYYDASTDALYTKYYGDKYYVGYHGSYYGIPYYDISKYGAYYNRAYFKLYELQEETAQTLEKYILYNDKSDPSSGDTSGHKMMIKVNKEWSDGAGNHTDDSVTMHLHIKGQTADYRDPITITASDNWTGSWMNLDASNDYEVTEESVDGYESDVNARDPITVTYWEEDTELKVGETYVFVYTLGSDSQTYALKSPSYSGDSLTGGTVQVYGDEIKGIEASEKWKVEAASDGSGYYLKNVNSGLYVYCDRGGFIASTTRDTIVYSKKDGAYRLSNTYDGTTFYMGNSYYGNISYWYKNSTYYAAAFTAYRQVENVKESQTWQVTNTKKNVTPSTGDDTVTAKKSVTVKKEWKDDATTHDPVTVSLYRNGRNSALYTVELSESNNWKYTWSDLSANYTYSVKEDAVAGYVATTNTSTVFSYNWTEASDLEAGETYALLYTLPGQSLPKALTAEGSNKLLSGTSEGINKSTDNTKYTQFPEKGQWTVESADDMGGIYLNNAAFDYGMYIYNDSGSSFKTTASVDTSGRILRYDGSGHLYSTYNNTKYYIGNSSGISGTTTDASQAATFTLYKRQLVSADQTITLTNQKSSGGTGTDTSGVTYPTTVTVKKKWSDESKDHSKDTVTVNLYKQEDQMQPCADPITLSADNDWTDSWAGLDANEEYVVKEVVPDGYDYPSTYTSITREEEWLNTSEFVDGRTYMLFYSLNGVELSLATTGQGEHLTGVDDDSNGDGIYNTVSKSAQWTVEMADGGFYLRNDNYSPAQYIAFGTVNSQYRFYTSSTEKTLLKYQDGYITTASGYTLGGKQIYNYTTGTNTGAYIQLYEKQTVGKQQVVTITNKPKPTVTSSDSKMTITAKKIWNDEEEDHKDQEVKVRLYKLGEDTQCADTLILSEENNWIASWEDMDAQTSYMVSEDLVDGYYQSYLDVKTNNYGSNVWVKTDRLQEGKTYALMYTLPGSNTQKVLYPTAPGDVVGGLSSGIVAGEDGTYTSLPSNAEWKAVKAADTAGGFYLTSDAYASTNATQYLYVGDSGIYTSSQEKLRTVMYYQNGGLYGSGAYVGRNDDISNKSYTIGTAATFELYEKQDTETVQTWTFTNTKLDDITSTGDDNSGDGDDGSDDGSGTVEDDKTKQPLDVNVTKSWASGSTKTPITVHLLDADGNRLDDTYGTKTLSSSNDWKASWEDLPYGQYTVEEELVDGYLPTYTGGLTGDSAIWVPVTKLEAGETYAFVYQDNVSTTNIPQYEYYTINAYGENRNMVTSDHNIGAATYNTSMDANCYEDDAIAAAAQWTAEPYGTGFTLKNTSLGTNLYMEYGGLFDGDGGRTAYCFATRKGIGINNVTTMKCTSAGNGQVYLSNYFDEDDTNRYVKIENFTVDNETNYVTKAVTSKTSASRLTLYKKVIPEARYDYTITNEAGVTDGDSITNVTATKKWDGIAAADRTPVTVHLYDEKGDLMDTRVLDTSNSWTTTWKNLPEGVYTVEEEDAKGYVSKATCTRADTNSFFTKVSTIEDGATYAIGYTYQGYTYVWRNNGAKANVIGHRATSLSDMTVGNITYKNNLSIPDKEDQWYITKYNASGSSSSSSSPAAYLIQTAAEGMGTYVKYNSDTEKIYVDDSIYAGLIYKSGNYWGVKESSTSSTVYGFNAYGSSYFYCNAYTGNGTSFSLYKKIAVTDYTYTITNKTVDEAKKDDGYVNITSAAGYTKTIDAMRDGVDNPDTTVDDDSTTDLTDLYRLYLNVGPTQLNQGVDLLLVVDNSSSMLDETQYGNSEDNTMERDMAIYKILNGSDYSEGTLTDDSLLSEFLSLNANNRVGVITFQGKTTSSSTSATSTYDVNTVQGWTHTLSKPVDITLTARDPDDANTVTGTNYTAAYYMANQMFNQTRATQYKNNKKIMIFISDGVPTYYFTDTTYSSLKGTRYGSGLGLDSNANKCKEPTLAMFDAFCNLNSDVTTYTIGFSEDVNTKLDGNSANPAVMRYMAEIGGGDYIPAENGDEVSNALKQYILVGGQYTNGEIVDELSQYVDLYDTPDYKVTMTVGSETTVLWGNNEKGGNGITPEGEGIIQDVTYDKATHTVKLKFNPDYQFPLRAKFELSFNVKTSEEAYDLTIYNREAGRNQYTTLDGTVMKGDEDTDYGTNATSSLKEGFRSNKEAYFSYFRDDEKGQLDYDHPVVQTSTTSLTIRKVSDTDKTVALEGAVFDLYQKATTGTTGTYTGGSNGTVKALPEGNYVKVKSGLTTSSANGAVYGTCTISGLNVGTYYLVETKQPLNYQLPEQAFRFRVMHSSIIVDAEEEDSQYLLTGSSDGHILTVANSKGETTYTLPETGGTGRNYIYWMGCILLLGAIGCIRAFYVYSKRWQGAHRVRK
jgi:hypothetical protein